MSSTSEEIYLVPLTSAPATLHALAVAGEAARHRRARVLAAYVIEVGYDLPMNAEMDTESRRGELVLRKAKQIAAEGRFEMEADLLQARAAGRAILDEAKHRSARVIVVGVPSASYGPLDMGKTADYLLSKAPCEVWLIREATKPS